MAPSRSSILDRGLRLLIAAALVGAFLLIAAPLAMIPQAHAQEAAPPVAGQPADVAALTAKAEAGDPQAQLQLGEAYWQGQGVKRDDRAARRWLEAAAPKLPAASRRLGEMYIAGAGGRKDVKKAMELWRGAEKAGDPMASILVADQLFSELTGGKQPGPGKFAFRGGVPVEDVETTESWYREALRTDPRPEVRQRAERALSALAAFKAAAQPKP